MKLGGSFISSRIGNVQNHSTETLGDIYVSEGRRDKYRRDKNKKKKKPIKNKKIGIKNENPRTFRAFIQIVQNKNTHAYEAKVSRDNPSELRPCETLIEQLTHVTVGQSAEALLFAAKKIGEERLKEILVGK